MPEPTTNVARSDDRRPAVPMFNIPEPNPLRGSNILIELNAPAARLLCDALDDVDLTADGDKPLFALKKHVRRYYGQIQEARKLRAAQQESSDSPRGAVNQSAAFVTAV